MIYWHYLLKYFLCVNFVIHDLHIVIMVNKGIQMKKANKKNFVAVIFSKIITLIVYICGVLSIALIIRCYFCEVSTCKNIEKYKSIVCFLRKNNDILFSAAIVVWGFTLTCVIFLLGHLEEIYYGTSLKRIVLLCFGKGGVSGYIVLYALLLPGMIWSFYKHYWLLNGLFQVINYAYSIGFIFFLAITSVRDTVIELIRSRTIKIVKKRKEIKSPYYDEQLPVLNMIRNLDYDDMWQVKRLEGIILDLIWILIVKSRLHVLYNIIFWIIQSSGYSSAEEKNRTVNMLEDVVANVLLYCREKKIPNDKAKQAIIGVILPMLQVDIVVEDGAWIEEMIGGIPWMLRREICVTLLLGAEYLNRGSIYCEYTVNELLNAYLKTDQGKAESEKMLKAMELEGWRFWLVWNKYNHIEEYNENLLLDFFQDYAQMNDRVCKSEILLKLQARKMRNEYHKIIEIV